MLTVRNPSLRVLNFASTVLAFRFRKTNWPGIFLAKRIFGILPLRDDGERHKRDKADIGWAMARVERYREAGEHIRTRIGALRKKRTKSDSV
jgi:hypothetical protein